MRSSFVLALALLGLASPALAQGYLSIGGSGRGRLDTGEQSRWTFTAAAGDVLQIDVESSAFDPVVEVFDGDGTSLGRDDDGGDGLASRLSNLRLPRAGTYEIVVSAYSNSANGRYRVALSRMAAPPEPRPTAYDRSERAVLGAGARDAWSFRGAEGDVVAVRMAGAFDTYLELLAPDGSPLSTNDDGGGERQALLSDVRLSQRGVYTIIARGYDATDAGSYTLTLTRTSGRGASVPDCGRAEPAYGAARLGTRVRIGRHRAVEGDDNWASGMQPYVGREALITRLGDVDDVGCTMVGLDVDGGDWTWRLRDLTLLPARPSTPQTCRPGAAADFGRVGVGSEVTLGRHRTTGGADNWSRGMDAYVGQRTRVRSLEGADGEGCALVSVDADDGAFVWRVRDLTLW